jgi:hypothetical protein
VRVRVYVRVRLTGSMLKQFRFSASQCRRMFLNLVRECVRSCARLRECARLCCD